MRQAVPANEDDFLDLSSEEITRRFRASVRDEVARQLAAGHPMYGADSSGRVYKLLPDGRCVWIPSHSAPEIDVTPSHSR